MNRSGTVGALVVISARHCGLSSLVRRLPFGALTSEGMSWVVSVSLPPDQSNACTEYATSLSGLSGFLSGLLHPTGFALG